MDNDPDNDNGGWWRVFRTTFHDWLLFPADNTPEYIVPVRHERVVAASTDADDCFASFRNILRGLTHGDMHEAMQNATEYAGTERIAREVGAVYGRQPVPVGK